jgi:hypothetical protein
MGCSLRKLNGLPFVANLKVLQGLLLGLAREQRVPMLVVVGLKGFRTLALSGLLSP